MFVVAFNLSNIYHLSNINWIFSFI